MLVDIEPSAAAYSRMNALVQQEFELKSATL